MKNRPIVWSLAGFDPCGGAGILADIKTFENLKAYGLGICTAITYQNDQEFEGVEWVSAETIINQIIPLLRRHSLDWVKVGLIESPEVLLEVVDYLRHKNPGVNIIWDPILRASSGFLFHENVERQMLFFLLKKLYLITPNILEMKVLYPDIDVEESAFQLSSICRILLKGGHKPGNESVDILYENREQFNFSGKKIPGDKHGTGCVLSSAILSYLALGNTIEVACKKAKQYTLSFIGSNETHLGYHNV